MFLIQSLLHLMLIVMINVNIFENYNILIWTLYIFFYFCGNMEWFGVRQCVNIGWFGVNILYLKYLINVLIKYIKSWKKAEKKLKKSWKKLKKSWIYYEHYDFKKISFLYFFLYLYFVIFMIFYDFLNLFIFNILFFNSFNIITFIMHKI